MRNPQQILANQTREQTNKGEDRKWDTTQKGSDGNAQDTERESPAGQLSISDREQLIHAVRAQGLQETSSER